MSELKVMVVDDDPVILEVTRALLQSRGYEIITRENALGTTAAILREKPDVVLLDIGMPGLCGDELLKVIKERGLLPQGRRPEFVFHSGVDGATLQRLVAETGALGGIEKTADHVAFLSAFDALLQRMRQPGSGAAA